MDIHRPSIKIKCLPAGSFQDKAGFPVYRQGSGIEIKHFQLNSVQVQGFKTIAHKQANGFLSQSAISPRCSDQNPKVDAPGFFVPVIKDNFPHQLTGGAVYDGQIQTVGLFVPGLIPLADPPGFLMG